MPAEKPTKRATRKPATKKPAAAKAAPKTTAGKKVAVAPAPSDPALKSRWLDAHTRLQRARTGEMAGWDATYEALGDILLADPPLYLAGGYKTARAFLTAELPGVNERTVRSYIRVARYFDPEDEQKHGISKLEQLLDYIEASGGAKLIPAKLNLARIKVHVPDEKGKGLRTRDFADLSFDDLRRAARAAKAKGASKAPSRAKEPPVVTAIRKALGAAKLRGVSVRLRQGRIDLGDITPAHLEAVCRALLAARIPMEGE